MAASASVPRPDRPQGCSDVSDDAREPAEAVDAPDDARDPAEAVDAPDDARDPAEAVGAPEARDPAEDDVVAAITDTGPDAEVDLSEVVADRPLEAVAPLGPLALGGTSVAGVAMGLAEIVPGFSGGTVALVAGIYERLIANIRQGARALSLLVRGRVPAALRALLVIEWPFVLALFVPMVITIFTAASRLQTLLEERPVGMSAVFLGLVLGAAVVAARQLRDPRPWHWLLVLGAGAGFFVLLGFSPGTIEDPSLLLFALGGAIAVCAWILPGVSGSFLLLLLGLYQPVVEAVGERDLLVILVLAIGLVVGIASFSTALNWLLARAHDIVLAVLLGLMLGSARVLWPWPVEDGFGVSSVIEAPPDAAEGLLALALGLTAFALVWMFGLASTAVQRWSQGRRDAE
jgi:putative membrane protein